MLVLIEAAFAYLIRASGKLVRTALGWATAMLFGKVPRERQIFLSVITLISLLWLLALVGMAFPGFAAFVFTFVPLQDSVPRLWIRIAMLLLAVLLPGVGGYLSLYLQSPEARPRPLRARAMAVVRGYPYTLGLSLTLVSMILAAPILRLSTMVRRLKVAHVPVIIAAEDYLAVVGEVQEALKKGGLETEVRQASWLLRLPTRILTVLAGGPIEKMVANQLTTLWSPRVEILLHPADLVITGKGRSVSRTRAALSEYLVFSKAHLTWTKEGNALEDKLLAAWKSLCESEDAGSARQLFGEVKAALRSEDLPYEEWEVIFRQGLMIERDLVGKGHDAPSIARASVPA